MVSLDSPFTQNLLWILHLPDQVEMFNVMRGSKDDGIFSLIPPSIDKTAKLIMSLNNTRALGWDGIPVGAWKVAVAVFAEPIRELVALSFRTASVPTAFKMAHVTPIYTGKGKGDLNHDKTQVMWSGKGRSSPSDITVGSIIINPTNIIEVLGVKFDAALTPRPHLAQVLSSAKAIRGTVRCLGRLIPAGDSLRVVARALAAGRLGYVAAAVYTVKEEESVDAMAKIQHVINDIARATLGTSRRSRIMVEELLNISGIPSLNRLAATTTAMETWKTVHGNHRKGVDPLSGLLGRPMTASMDRTRTRSVASGLIEPPLKKAVATFVWEAYRAWNGIKVLREATSITAAKKAAATYASSLPV